MERYFFNYINSPISNLIYLPIEIQDIIIDYLYPLPFMNCTLCKQVILYKDKYNVLSSNGNYSIIKGKAICVNCQN